MIVIALDNGDEGLRGFLTRWLLELKPNAFIGNVTATVRDQIWDGIISENQNRLIGAVMAYSMNNEQGFALRMIGDSRRVVEDFEGVQLITYKNEVTKHFGDSEIKGLSSVNK